MHRYIPNLFFFIDQYDDQIFKSNIANIGIIYRNYNNAKKERDLIKVKKQCNKKNYQLYVSNNIKLALKVKADGIYIPAFSKLSKFKNLIYILKF